MKESVTFSEFKEKLPVKYDAPSWSAKHFQDEATEKAISITPAEQLRYEQNSNLAEIVAKELDWLIDVKDIDQAALEKKLKSFKDELSPVQFALMAKIKNRLVLAISEAKKIDQTTAEQMYKKLVDDSHYPPADSIQINPFGMIMVKSSKWNLMHLDSPGFTYEPTEADRQKFDPKTFAFLQRLVVIRDTPEEAAKRSPEEIKRHETFHFLYNIAIRPESSANYKFELEKRYFLQAKNEMIAYLLINQWPWDAKALLAELKPKQKRITDFDDRTNDDVFLHVYQKICRDIGNSLPEKEYKKETEDYPDQMYLCLREMARLDCIGSQDFESAIKAVLTAQDFKEMTEKLKKIGGETKLSWKESLPDILKLPPQECVHRLKNLATLQRDYRLRFSTHAQDENRADWDYFYDQVKEYIHGLKNDTEDKDRDIAANELIDLLKSFGVEVED
ncbi:MAG: hypothetical protein PHS79_02220 [Patescibacteria group bacterium]|nr:hypothetical protein [Patescibacteria group bacterium]